MIVTLSVWLTPDKLQKKKALCAMQGREMYATAEVKLSHIVFNTLKISWVLWFV